jgi:DNA-binding MarR family transcriptional regulator
MQIYYSAAYMKPTRQDVQDMVLALFTVVGSLERARRRTPGARMLALLHLVADREQIHPSKIAAELGVHQSTITRQIQPLEDAGHVALIPDPDDRRSHLVTLTDAGRDEQHRLHKVGLDRFALFVAGWEAEEVRALTRLLIKLEESKAEVARRERRSSGRHWQVKGAR